MNSYGVRVINYHVRKGSYSGANVETYTGETDLVFFTDIKSEENAGITLSPGEESTLDLQEIGEGSDLSVENLSHNNSGAYTVKI